VTVTLLFVLIPATVSSAFALTTIESAAWYHQGKINAIKDFKAHILI